MTGCVPGMGADLLSRMTAPDAVVRRRGSWQTVAYRGHSWWESVFLWQGRALVCPCSLPEQTGRLRHRGSGRLVHRAHSRA